MMRSVSFVDRLELEFPGNHFSHGVCLGDVDGDGLNELIIGNVDGVLAIFKGDSDTRPWRSCSDLGIITSVTVGDILNRGQDVVICVNAEGICHIFDLHQTITPEQSSSPDGSQTSTSIRPFHSQPVSLNVKTILVASISDDGRKDMFVGYTDQAVGAYRWDSTAGSLVEITRRLPLPRQVGSLSVGESVLDGGCGQLLVAQAGGTYIPIVYRTTHTGEVKEDDEQPESPVELTYEKGSMDGVVGVVQRRNPNVCTEVVGSIVGSPSPTSSPSAAEKDEKQKERLTAICTLDGSIKLLKGENKQWELQVDHNLFALHRLDITGSGCDEIVGCAWDGMTYIVDQQRNVVKYHVGENVCAFCAGYYGDDGRNVPCLVYTTFHNQILVYHNVSLPSIPSTNLLQSLQPEELPVKLKKKWNSFSDVEKKNFIHTILYGQCHD